MTLPSPLEITALGTTCMLLGVAAVLLLKAIRLGVILVLVAIVLFGFAGVAHSYKQQGAFEVQVKWDADKKARMDHLAQVIVERNDAAAKEEQAARARSDELDRQFDQLSAAHRTDSARLSAVTVDNAMLAGLLDTVRAANAAISTDAGKHQADASRTPTRTLCTGEQLDAWFQAVAKNYDKAIKYGDACVAFYEKQRGIQ